MDAEWLWPCPSSPAAAAALSMVLDNDYMLGEVLIRLIFPTSLVRAAAVCRSWLRVVSNQAFLRRFRDLHPPRLLGLYVQNGRLGSPRFVPTPHPPAELAAAIRRAGSILDDGRRLVRRDSHLGLPERPYPRRSQQQREARTRRTQPAAPCGRRGRAPAAAVRNKFQHLDKSHERHDRRWCGLRRRPEMESAVSESNPQLPRTTGWYGTWQWHNLTSVNFPSRLRLAVLISRPFNGKLYLMVCANAIATLPLTLSMLPNLSIISLPDGVECRPLGKVKPWVDDSGLYLIHIKELQLRVWLHDMDSGQWLLQNTVCLHEVCAQLGVADLVSADGLSTTTDIKICEVGHSAEFVLLQVGLDVLYIHIKSRNAEKVYTIKPGECLLRLVPFVMIWPPNFPGIKEDCTQNK